VNDALVPRRELVFQLLEVLRLEELLRQPRFAEHDRATFAAVIDTAYEIAAERFAPFAALADVEEPRIENGRVVLPPCTAAALDAYGDAGFIAMPFDRDVGGLQMPVLLNQACGAVFASANAAFQSYVTLSQGVANLVASFGSEPQKRRYLAPLLEGRWHGTMCLSEPHAGSSLADIRTLAVQRADGRYELRGSKMWISGGEHELGENIVHMVLARTPDAPPGVKGISLFIVPRWRVDSDGEAGESNGVALVGLNHKMGWRGHVNTALSFGDREPCIGELVGMPHQGLAYMFQLMNEARVAVGISATGLGYAGYRYSLEYARNRLQGRRAGQRDPATAPVPIIEHADVRRMLLAQKVRVEGALSLSLYCARLVDDIATASSEEIRNRTLLLLELLTPIAKSWPAEQCLEANKLAIQVLGGAGYTRDHPVERLYRDNRLNMIHEGAHGIHGLDLLGRKVLQQKGRALQILLAKIETTIKRAQAVGGFDEECRVLAAAARALTGATRRLASALHAGDAERGLANATLYLDAMGDVVVAWRWLAQAQVARAALVGGSSQGDSEQAFYDGKIRACRYFIRYELPRVASSFALLAKLDDTTLTMPDASF
jgi:alkylation response protein AidB-like acyl-CoA dehydrogenase